MKTLLVIGSGGREHALAWKLSQSPSVESVYVAPGNAGTALEPALENVDVASDDVDSLLAFAQKHAIDFTVVGPEAPLVNGVVDAFEANGLACFGPTSKAAQLEGSKVFSKDFMKRHAIPTAEYQSFTSIEPAIAYLQDKAMPIVIKADGLAAGKGVVIAENLAEAEATVTDMLVDKAYGDASASVVIEEFLHGEEASFIVVADGLTALPMASSQDHKARDDGDKGPNTGGMGAYSPAPVVNDEVAEAIMQQVIQPTIDGMRADGHPFKGFLYAGVMISPKGGIKVLEFNVRFGDPETQPIMMRLTSDLLPLLEAARLGQVSAANCEWDQRVSVGVVMAAQGYPADYPKGDAISIDAASIGADQKIFHAGTVLDGEQVLTSGGRVLCAVAMGESATEAQQKAYDLVAKISWDGAYFRRDIAYRAVKREQN